MTSCWRTTVAVVCLMLLISPIHAVAAEPVARRVVTLSPHLAELVYAVGAGDTLLGKVAVGADPDQRVSCAGRINELGEIRRQRYNPLVALERLGRKRLRRLVTGPESN